MVDKKKAPPIKEGKAKLELDISVNGESCALKISDVGIYTVYNTIIPAVRQGNPNVEGFTDAQIISRMIETLFRNHIRGFVQI